MREMCYPSHTRFQVLNQLIALEDAAEPIAKTVPEPGAGEEVAAAKEPHHDVSVEEDDAIGELFRCSLRICCILISCTSSICALRVYACSLLDSNQNGVLDRDELRKVHGDATACTACLVMPLPVQHAW